MSVAMLEERPPFVEFFEADVEDRDASIKAGHYVGKDVTFVKVTPVGGNLTFEDVAEDWLKRKSASGDRFARQYQEHFKAYKDGVESPVSGTPIRTWPALSPAQVKVCLSLNIRAVEDLAVINDETKQRIGMGAQSMKQKAIDWLTAASGTGKAAEEMSALKARLDNLEVTLEGKNELIAELKSKLPAETPRRQRPGKSLDSIDQILNLNQGESVN